MSRAVAVISLGCAKNLVDAEVAVGTLLHAGYVLVDDERAADVVVVNTCAFIGPARDEAAAVLSDVASKIKKDAVLAVTGCWAQRERERLRGVFPRVDLVVGVSDQGRLAALVRRVRRAKEGLVAVTSPRPPLEGIGARPRLTAPHVAFLKIADGCDHPCSFCIIPQLRGPFRSRSEDDIVREAEKAAAEGVQEIILLAQDSSRYGENRGSNLARLLRRLDLTAPPWVRVLYLHPARITAELVEVFATARRVVKYLDLPLQHVAPRLLAAMGRPVRTPDQVLETLVGLREDIPGVAIRTSLIVGFPGETDEDFDALVKFVDEARFDHVGVFEFSAEEGTVAIKLPGRVPAATARARAQEIMFRQQEVLARKYRDWIDVELDILVDGKRGDLLIGRTYFQSPDVDPVTLVDGPGQPGAFIRARVAGHDGYDLVARVAGRRGGA